MDQQSFRLSLAAAHHLQSFNFMAGPGLNKMLNHFTPMELNSHDLAHDANKPLPTPFQMFKLTFSQLKIGQPYRFNDPTAIHQEIYPQECRLAGKTYTAPLIAEITRQIDDNLDTFTVNLGEIPIMVGSEHCHLHGLSPEDLIKLTEDPNEFGGYFIVNGNEKIVRMLVLQKRNYPVAFLRPSYSNRGPGYTEFAVQMRCVREDFFAKTFTLHYISDGNVYLRILYKKQEFLCPIIVILKGILNLSDREVYTRLMKGNYSDSDRSDKL
jgi:DNA-directed RNA polymerase I subunit RPA2